MQWHSTLYFQQEKFDRISEYTFKIFNMTFDNFIKFRVLILLHKLVHEQIPEYLFKKLVFSTSARTNFLNQIKHNVSERQFLIFATRLWNSLPSNITIIRNKVHLKRILSTFNNYNWTFNFKFFIISNFFLHF